MFIRATLDVISDFLGRIHFGHITQLNYFVRDRSFINAHGERSRELRFPSQQRVE
jgi:hypothetical protein